MVNRGEVQEAFPFRDGSAPSSYARPSVPRSPGGIFTQQRGVLVFKTCLRLFLASCSHLHGRILSTAKQKSACRFRCGNSGEFCPPLFCGSP